MKNRITRQKNKINNHSKNNKNSIFIFFIICLIISCIILFINNIFLYIKYDKLKDTLQIMENNKYINNKVFYDSNDFNYLAIGNSITKHPICEYWWSERGMAATEDGKDYFSIVRDYINDKYENATSRIVTLTAWELQEYDRYEVLTLLDRYLDLKLNLITIQLSENVHGRRDQFKRDYKELIEYIRDKCPFTQIILIDDYFDYNNHILKKELSKEMNIKFADLSEIFGDKEYMLGENSKVKDSDGNIHTNISEGVAMHPGDKGMKYIADKVIALIK